MHLQKKNVQKYIALLAFTSLVGVYAPVSGADVVSTTFSTQTASGKGSSDSSISVDANMSYINKGNNSSVIGNFFVGEYHDSMYGYYTLDWSSTKNQNVRVISSTNACGNSYGYKLGGYAYSEYYGFVDFDYSSSVFVYYCNDDKKLHGYAYNSDLGFQNFEGIAFDIEVVASTVAEVPVGNTNFVNDTSGITEQESPGSNGNTTIQADRIEFEAVEESLFYIIK